MSDPGIITYEWLKDYFFRYKSKDDMEVSDKTKQRIRDYIRHIQNHKDKRNWDGAKRQRENTIYFADQLLKSS